MKRVILDKDRVRVSKPGKSAESADLNDFLVHESFAMESVIGGVRYVSSVPAIIPHGLGYKPIVLVVGGAKSATTDDVCEIIAYADEQNIYVYSYYSLNNTIRFNVLYQPATPVPLLILGAQQP